MIKFQRKIQALVVVAMLLIMPSVSHANKLAWDLFTGVVTEVAGNLMTDLITGGDTEDLKSRISYLQNNIRSYSAENHANYKEVSILINNMGSKMAKLDRSIRSMEKRLSAIELNISVRNARLRVDTNNHIGVRMQDIEVNDKAAPSFNKPSFKKKLNMLVFNASSSSSSHVNFSNGIKSKYPTLMLSKQLNWIDKFVMQHTLIFYQGASNKKYAERLAEWMPGKQVVRDYINNPSGFFGFAKNRDLIVFIGQDYPAILRHVRR